MSDDKAPDPPPADEPRPKDTEEAVGRALARANVISELLRTNGIPGNDVTVMAFTIMAAHAALQTGMSVNDAFSIYLAVFEQIEHTNQERAAAMVERLKNGLGSTIARVMGIAESEKKETTH